MAALTSQHLSHCTLVAHTQQSLLRQCLYVTLQLAARRRQKPKATGVQVPLHHLMQQFHCIHSSRGVSAITNGKRCRDGVVTTPSRSRLLLLKLSDVKRDRVGHVVKSKDGRHLNDQTGCHTAEQTVVNVHVARRLPEHVRSTYPVIANVDNLNKTPAASGCKTWNRTPSYARSKSNMLKTSNTWTMFFENIHCFLNVNIV